MLCAMAESPSSCDRHDAQAQRARCALDDLRGHGGALGGSALAEAARRAAAHFGGRDAVGQGPEGTTDSFELWGRRIGRGLSFVACVGLAIYLAWTYLR